MLIEKQKNIISYQLYNAKKSKQPNYLCNVINKFKHIQKIEAVESDAAYEDYIRRKLNQKRIQQIKKIHKSTKISKPDPYIKRTWVPPLQAQHMKQQTIFANYKKSPNAGLLGMSDQQATKKIYNILDINKKLHCFGEYMYSQFDDKQNNGKVKYRAKDKKMDIMHKQYSKLLQSIKKSMLICNKTSNLNQKIFLNPLQQDKYYQKIIRKTDEQLTQLLIVSLMVSANFTFSSFIQFYELFVWQQATKKTQLEFVIKVLMGLNAEISYKKLSQVIDFLCSKINLLEHKQSLNGFNQVMKKLIFGVKFPQCGSDKLLMTRQQLAQSLQVNEECISIFINVFYSQ